jgi:hypothetical protein
MHTHMRTHVYTHTHKIKEYLKHPCMYLQLKCPLFVVVSYRNIAPFLKLTGNCKSFMVITIASRNMTLKVNMMDELLCLKYKT